MLTDRRGKDDFWKGLNDHFGAQLISFYGDLLSSSDPGLLLEEVGSQFELAPGNKVAFIIVHQKERHPDLQQKILEFLQQRGGMILVLSHFDLMQMLELRGKESRPEIYLRKLYRNTLLELRKTRASASPVKEVRNLTIEGEQGAALKALQNYCEKRQSLSAVTEVSQLFARHSKNERDYNLLGILSRSEYNEEFQKINFAILNSLEKSR